MQGSSRNLQQQQQQQALIVGLPCYVSHSFAPVVKRVEQDVLCFYGKKGTGG